MENTTLYCELMTMEEVETFHSWMTEEGLDYYDCPKHYTERKPIWMIEHRYRKPEEDPLCVIIVELMHEQGRCHVTSGFRCEEGEKISKEMMMNILLARSYN